MGNPNSCARRQLVNPQALSRMQSVPFEFVQGFAAESGYGRVLLAGERSHMQQLGGTARRQGSLSGYGLVAGGFGFLFLRGNPPVDLSGETTMDDWKSALLEWIGRALVA
jgi:hypothetical protein